MLVNVYIESEVFDSINSNSIIKVYAKQMGKKWYVCAKTNDSEQYQISPISYNSALEIEDAVEGFKKALFGEYFDDIHPDLFV
jgi:hypothetical protein